MGEYTALNMEAAHKELQYLFFFLCLSHKILLQSAKSM